MPSLITKRGRRRYVGTVWVNNRRGPQKLFPDDSEKSYREAIIWESKAAETFRQKLEEEAAQIDTASLSVEQWVDDYLDYIVNHHFSNRTYKEKKSAFERLAAFDGIHPDMPVDDIDRFTCAALFNAQMKYRTGNAVNKDRKNLGAAWQWGMNNLRGWPEVQNPFLAVPRKPQVRTPRYVPPEEDFWAVFDYVAEKAAASGDEADIQDRIMLLAYLHLAARRSELFRTTWSDVDFSRGRIRLWTRKREGGDMECDWLPMTGELAAELKVWKKRRMAQPTQDSAHLFVCLYKFYLCDPYYGKPFRKRIHTLGNWCKKAAVKTFGWHAIRHLTASTLYRRGYNLGHIQAVLRHKSATTTARYLRTIGIDEVREVLNDGLRREAKVIPLQSKKASGGRP